MILKIMQRIILVLCIAIQLVSCVDEDIPSDNKPGAGSGTTRISLQLPAVTELPTYALEATDENYIRLIDVLVFDENDEFLYQISGSNVANDNTGTDGNKKTFEAVLTRTDPGDKVRLVVIANARYYLGNNQPGESKSTILNRMVFGLPSDKKWLANRSDNFDPIPMWGESGFIEINNTPIPSISMLRSLARIDIGLNYQGNAPAGINGFELKEIYVYNIKTKGRVAPDEANFSSADGWVTAPTLPAESGIDYKGPILYTPSSKLECARQIYVMESPAGEKGKEDEAFCILVGGKFPYGSAGDTLTRYYRIDLLKTVGGNQEYLQILRNHRYKINIKSVNKMGYPTKEEAFREMSFNNSDLLDVEIQTENVGNGIISDGQYFLSVQAAIRNNYQTNEAVDNCGVTVLTSNPEGWTVEVPSYYASWITLTGATSGPANQKKEFTFNLAPTDSLRSASIIIKAGKMQTYVYIQQGVGRKIPANYGGLGNAALEVTFKPPGNPGAIIYSWYEMANVPYGYNSLEVPPAGPQLYPPMKNSCAALDLHGYHNWRLPDIVEAKAIFNCVIDEYVLKNYQFWNQFISMPTASASEGNEINCINRSQNGGSTDPVTQKYIPNMQSNAYDKATMNSTWYQNNNLRCVRTLDENFYTVTGTRMNMAPGEEKSIIFYAPSTISWTKENLAQYDAIVASTTTPVKLAEVEHGLSKWEIRVKMKTTFDVTVNKAVLIVKNNQDNATKRIELAQTSGYAYIVPDTYTNLGYHLYVTLKDAYPYTQPWYLYANTPNGYNSIEVPPAGSQVTTDTGPDGTRPNSCASLRDGGYADWRLPTLDELKLMMSYFKANGGFGKYSIAQNLYWSSTTNISDNSRAYYMSLNDGVVSDTYKYAAFGLARCVRTGNDVFYAPPGREEIPQQAGAYTFIVYSNNGLSSSYDKGPGFDDAVSSVTMTPQGMPDGRGLQKYLVTLNVKLNTQTADKRTISMTLHSNGSETAIIKIKQEGFAIMFSPATMAMPDGLWLIKYDYAINRNWNTLASVPASVVNTDVPPKGMQVTWDIGPDGTQPGSCAELRLGGYKDWRLPTLAEGGKAFTYMTNNGGSSSYGLTNGYYHTSTTYNNGAYATTSQVSIIHINGANTTFDYKHSNSYMARCVRTASTFYALPDTVTFRANRQGNYRLILTSEYPLSSAYVKGPGFDNMISSVTATKFQISTEIEQWIVDFTVKDAQSASKTESYIRFNATDGIHHLQVPLIQNVAYYSLTAAQLSLAYNLMVAGDDRPYFTDWYTVANVPNNTNDLVVPTNGSAGQITGDIGVGGSRPGACKDSNLGGYTDWRMPTSTEFANMLSAFYALQANKRSEVYGFAMGPSNYRYWVATSSSAANANVYYVNSAANSTSSGGFAKSTANQYTVRCVRTN